MAQPPQPIPDSGHPSAGAPRRRLSIGKRIMMTLVTFGLVICAAEFAIRIRDARMGYGFFNSNRDPLVRPAEKLLPFRMFGVRPYQSPGIITSRHGEQYPIAKPPGTFRIVCLGGSTTECYSETTTGVSTDYPIALQKRLRAALGRDNIEVINMGHSAVCTAQMLILLQLDVLSWQPDLVIASENINDLLINWFPDFKPDYSHVYKTPYFAMPDTGRAPNLLTAIPQQFQLYWIIANKISALDFAGRKKMRRAPWGDTPLPGEATFRRNLESMAAICKSHGVTLVLATQPEDPREALFDLHHGYKDYNHLIQYPLHSEFLMQHAHYNEIIKHTGAAFGVPVVDNATAMAGHPEFFVDHVHYNDAGVAFMAGQFADFLIGSGLLNATTQPVEVQQPAIRR